MLKKQFESPFTIPLLWLFTAAPILFAADDSGERTPVDDPYAETCALTASLGRGMFTDSGIAPEKTKGYLATVAIYKNMAESANVGDDARTTQFGVSAAELVKQVFINSKPHMSLDLSASLYTYMCLHRSSNQTMLMVSEYVSPLIGRKCESRGKEVLLCIGEVMGEANEILQRIIEESGVQLPE